MFKKSLIKLGVFERLDARLLMALLMVCLS